MGVIKYANLRNFVGIGNMLPGRVILALCDVTQFYLLASFPHQIWLLMSRFLFSSTFTANDVNYKLYRTDL